MPISDDEINQLKSAFSFQAQNVPYPGNPDDQTALFALDYGVNRDLRLVDGIQKAVPFGRIVVNLANLPGIRYAV